MIQATGIDHIVLHVDDLARSRTFYTKVPGMKAYREDDGQVFLHAGHQGVALFKRQGGGALTAGNDLNHLALTGCGKTRFPLQFAGDSLVERGG